MSRQEELITQLQQEISILKRENEKLKTDLELIESELPYNKEYDV
jgi:cell shape-determining protein MreC